MFRILWLQGLFSYGLADSHCRGKYSTAIFEHWQLRWRRLFELRLTNNTASAIFYLLYAFDNH